MYTTKKWLIQYNSPDTGWTNWASANMEDAAQVALDEFKKASAFEWRIVLQTTTYEVVK